MAPKMTLSTRGTGLIYFIKLKDPLALDPALMLNKRAKLSCCFLLLVTSPLTWSLSPHYICGS